MINVSRLWNNNKFKSLTNNSKLLYLYLATNAGISYVGIVSNQPEEISQNLLLTIEDVRISTKELIDQKYIYVIKSGDYIYWIIPSHFSTVGSSDSIIEKIKSDFKSLPTKVQDFLDSIGINASKKRKKFDKPTIDEIQDYANKQGYLLNAEEFYNFYENSPKSNEHLWYDSRGKIVLDWKAKLRKVWFKEDQKLKKLLDAPKGFEFFHIIVDNKTIFPDSWKDGKPQSKDFIISKKLQKEYEERKKNS